MRQDGLEESEAAWGLRPSGISSTTLCRKQIWLLGTAVYATKTGRAAFPEGAVGVSEPPGFLRKSLVVLKTQTSEVRRKKREKRLGSESRCWGAILKRPLLSGATGARYPEGQVQCAWLTAVSQAGCEFVGGRTGAGLGLPSLSLLASRFTIFSQVLLHVGGRHVQRPFQGAHKPETGSWTSKP